MSTAIVLINLGTPDSPTPPAIKRYLAEIVCAGLKTLLDCPRLKIPNPQIPPDRCREQAILPRNAFDDMNGLFLPIMLQFQQRSSKAI